MKDNNFLEKFKDITNDDIETALISVHNARLVAEEALHRYISSLVDIAHLYDHTNRLELAKEYDLESDEMEKISYKMMLKNRSLK